MGLAEPGPAGAVLRVEVVYAPRPGEVDVVALELTAGACVADALRASGLLQRHGLAASLQDGVPDASRVGVWGRVQPVSHALRDRDRVEIYRPLKVDPKEARRLRYKQHLERVAGTAPRQKR
jgi:putative ubiquitin-RnfH superfamily antitoxin RatB of RatAB toxin-antitoxin module